MSFLRSRTALMALYSMISVGCAQLDGDITDKPAAKERWNRQNDPSGFRGIQLTYKLDEMPSRGRAEREIWPSTYWATQDNSINVRWSPGELSPAEKYDKAFNGWVPDEGFMALRPYQKGADCAEFDRSYYDKLGPLATHISEHMGNKAARDGVDSDGDGEIDECGDRDGVEFWFGLCHAWVPAAMLEDRPLKSVEHNGVTFHPGDLEALLIAAYNRSGADIIGSRCNDKDDDVERDEQGRAVDVKCRDTNAGTLHVIMSNYLGLNSTSFAEDRTYNYEVWNQPVVAYEVTKMDQITAAKANEMLGLTGDTYVRTPEATTFYDVNATLTYLTESHASREPADAAHYERNDHYTYILEVDSAGNVIGGEWYGESKTSHPDFLWNPRRAIASSVPHLDLDEVRRLIRKSRAENNQDNSALDPLFFEVLPDVDIPDNDPAGVSIELFVPDGTAGEISVTTVFSHEDLSQVKVGVLSPTGESWALIEGGTATGSTFYEDTITLDPQPIGELTGTWRLVVTDLAPEKRGLVELFQLAIVPHNDNSN
ncbi:MAG: proprotein convertase P-domain-containing protein [Myxococcota bacterium]|nr:proprotein convertase P-domain-containing protein [Myxococcota bacterium]